MKLRSCTALLLLILAAHAASHVGAARFQLRRETNTDTNPDIKEGDRVLQKAAAYTDPVWFASYKKIAGKAFKRCKLLNNVAPADGSTCSNMKVGDYSCAFGDQTCPDGSTHPDVKCDCNIGSGNGVWSCEAYKPCEVSPPVETCPTKHPITFNPPLTCSAGMICPIGTVRCCGKVFPRTVCTCDNGVFRCSDDKSCIGKCPKKEVKPENATVEVVAPLPIKPSNATTLENPSQPEVGELPMEPSNTTTLENPSQPEVGGIPTEPPKTTTVKPAIEECPDSGSLIPPEQGTVCTLDPMASCAYDKVCW